MESRRELLLLAEFLNGKRLGRGLLLASEWFTEPLSLVLEFSWELIEKYKCFLVQIIIWNIGNGI